MFDLSFEENEISQIQYARPVLLHPSVRVVVKVKTQEEGHAIRARVERGWDLLGIVGVGREDWASRLTFEVVV